MIVHKRQRAILFPLVLYSVLGLVTSYFVFHATHGDRSLAAKEKLKKDLAVLALTLDEIKKERVHWEHKIALLNDQHVDADLLEEQARHILGLVHRDDVVVMLNSHNSKDNFYE
jgi:cell division protein FtsB